MGALRLLQASPAETRACATAGRLELPGIQCWFKKAFATCTCVAGHLPVHFSRKSAQGVYVGDDLPSPPPGKSRPRRHAAQKVAVAEKPFQLAGSCSLNVARMKIRGPVASPPICAMALGAMLPIEFCSREHGIGTWRGAKAEHFRKSVKCFSWVRWRRQKRGSQIRGHPAVVRSTGLTKYDCQKGKDEVSGRKASSGGRCRKMAPPEIRRIRERVVAGLSVPEIARQAICTERQTRGSSSRKFADPRGRSTVIWHPMR